MPAKPCKKRLRQMHLKSRNRNRKTNLNSNSKIKERSRTSKISKISSLRVPAKR